MPGPEASPCEGLPYDIPLDNLSALEGARRVAVQVPPGLRPFLDKIGGCVAERLPGAEVLLHMDPVYGACDLAYPQLAEIAGVDGIVHIGHTPYPLELAGPHAMPSSVRTVFLPAYSRAWPGEEALSRAADILRERGASRVAVVGTAQHVHQLGPIGRALSDLGLEALVPRGYPPFFGDGQVIGCDYRVAARASSSVDAFVYVGGGRFHPLGLYLALRRPVVIVDPYRGEAWDFTGEGERVLKSRLFRVMRAMDARSIAVIAGLKTGQYRPRLVSALLGLARRRGVKALVYLSDRLSLEDLRSIPRADAVVVTSCPRLPIDDLAEHELPVLTPGEARMALTGRLEPYVFPW